MPLANAVNYLNLLAQNNIPPAGSPQDPNPVAEGVGGTFLGIGFTPLITILILAAILIPLFMSYRKNNPNNRSPNPRV